MSTETDRPSEPASVFVASGLDPRGYRCPDCGSDMLEVEVFAWIPLSPVTRVGPSAPHTWHPTTNNIRCRACGALDEMSEFSVSGQITGPR